MKRRILYALTGLALIASFGFASPLSTSATMINPCDVIGVLIHGYFEQGQYGKAKYWSEVSIANGCGFGAL